MRFDALIGDGDLKAKAARCRLLSEFVSDKAIAALLIAEAEDFERLAIIAETGAKARTRASS